MSLLTTLLRSLDLREYAENEAQSFVRKHMDDVREVINGLEDKVVAEVHDELLKYVPDEYHDAVLLLLRVSIADAAEAGFAKAWSLVDNINPKDGPTKPPTL